MLGFLGDLGDLAKLVQGKEGVRPRDDLDEALAHELADCLWCVMTLADAYDVDLGAAFASTMDDARPVAARPPSSAAGRRVALVSARATVSASRWARSSGYSGSRSSHTGSHEPYSWPCPSGRAKSQTCRCAPPSPTRYTWQRAMFGRASTCR